MSREFVIQNRAFNVNDDILEKSDPKPFIHHLAREDANAINTFLRDNFEPNTSNMSGNNGNGQGGGMVAYYGQPVRGQLSETRGLPLIELKGRDYILRICTGICWLWRTG